MSSLRSLVAVCALALGSAAWAAPVTEVGSSKSLGTGVGTYSISATKDTAFAVKLYAGTYTFTLSPLTENGDSNITQAWLSASQDNSASNGNDFGSYDISGSAAPGSFTETLVVRPGKTTTVYLNVLGTHLGKAGRNDVAGYSATLSVSAVPEPSSTTALLAGLGLLAAVARRRKVQP